MCVYGTGLTIAIIIWICYLTRTQSLNHAIKTGPIIPRLPYSQLFQGDTLKKGRKSEVFHHARIPDSGLPGAEGFW